MVEGSKTMRTTQSKRRRGGFTLMELMIVVIVMIMLAGMVLGALSRTRARARIEQTKATIAKIDRIIRMKIDSYQGRRLPIAPGATRMTAAQRQQALFDLMRMELPERYNDISDRPLPGGSAPALNALYKQKYFGAAFPSGDFSHAECLYITVMSIPEARASFNQNEIGDVDKDGWPEFLDGFGRPIYWLRWAPGFPTEGSAAPAMPPYLIYSCAGHKKADGTDDYGVNTGQDIHFKGNPAADMSIGSLVGAPPITNHDLQ
jgi:hypothetical protein